MGRLPTYDASLTRGSWAKDEDVILKSYIEINGVGNWKHLPKLAGLKRCGKSCRLRWINYLRPDIKRGNFSEAEEKLIVDLHSVLGNKWSRIASQMEGRTDNEIKNYWNTTIKKKLLMKGIDPVTHQQRADFNILENLPNLIAAASNLNNFAPNPLTNNAFHQIPPNMQLLQSLIRAITNSSLIPNTEAMSQLQSLIALHNLNQSPFGLSVPSTNLVDLLGSLMNCGISTLNEFGMNNRGVGVSTSTINDTTTSYFSSPTTIDMPSLQTITNTMPSMLMTSSIAHDKLIQSPFGFPVSSTNLVGLPGSLMNHGGCSSNEFGMNNSGVGASTSTITDTTATTTSCFSYPVTITMPSLQTTPNIMPSQMTSHENILGNQASDVVNIGDFTSSTSNGQILDDDIDLDFNWEDILKACNHGEIRLDGSY